MAHLNSEISYHSLGELADESSYLSSRINEVVGCSAPEFIRKNPAALSCSSEGHERLPCFFWTLKTDKGEIQLELTTSVPSSAIRLKTTEFRQPSAKLDTPIDIVRYSKTVEFALGNCTAISTPPIAVVFRLPDHYTRAKLHINWPWAIGVDIHDIRAANVSYLDKPVPACFFSDEKPITVRPGFDLVIAYQYTGYCPHGFVIGSLFDLTFTVTPE